MTVSKAYGLLESEGIVERRRGRPLMVKALPKSDLEARKTAQLRPEIEALLTKARQLGLSQKQIIELIRDIMRNAD